MTRFEPTAGATDTSEAEGITCLACGLRNPNGAAFCAHCGAHQDRGSDQIEIVDLVRMALALIAAAAGVQLILSAGSAWTTIDRRDQFPGFVDWEFWLLGVLHTLGAISLIGVWAAASSGLRGEDAPVQGKVVAALGGALLIGTVVATIGFHV
ncbi:MAG TPA: zinc ribbon domain-containing protein [Dehalococcoidia bacterium]|nr:zinc ribbon domain-containing protein [Dehalococcoidia bacterium]